tara:strand:+ start:4 stop:579 length:576 start_codon:yes stop_codon:yes gene_type:complete
MAWQGCDRTVFGDDATSAQVLAGLHALVAGDDGDSCGGDSVPQLTTNGEPLTPSSAAFPRAFSGDDDAPFLTTYEWLSRDPYGEVRRMAAWLHLELSDEDVQQAVAAASLETMRKADHHYSAMRASGDASGKGGGRDGERVSTGSACGFVDEPEPVRAALDDVTARLFEESPLLGLLYRPDGTVSLGPQCR